MAAQQDLIITRGKTFTLVIRWGTEPIVYKAITAIQQSAPVRITAVGHGLVDGWSVAVTNAKGMAEINAEANNVRNSDFHPATVIDADTIEINDINASGFKPYASGGIIQFNTPVDLAGYKARDTIKKKVGKNMLICTGAGTTGSVLPTGPGPDGGAIWSTTALPAETMGGRRRVLGWRRDRHNRAPVPLDRERRHRHRQRRQDDHAVHPRLRFSRSNMEPRDS